jgi:hypothetical protein
MVYLKPRAIFEIAYKNLNEDILPKFNKFLRQKYEKDIIYLNSFDKEGIFTFIFLILRDNFLLKKFI